MRKPTRAKIKELEPDQTTVESDSAVETPMHAEASEPDANSSRSRGEVDWSKVGRIEQKSLEARWRLEKWSVIRELWRANLQMVTFYMKPEGGNLSLEDAIKQATTELQEGPMLEEEMERISAWHVDAISWYTLDRIFRSKPSYAEQIWQEVKCQALNDFKSGHFAAEMFERTDWQRDVWKRSHFVVVYEEMMKAYEPRDAIEHSMVEMVAVNFFLWRHWVQEHLQRATTEPRRESHDYQEWVKRNADTTSHYGGSKHTRKRENHWTNGRWDIPYQHEADAIQQALEMADRCRRAFHSSVRSLRDWRRYSVPVIVQNAEQVNIAGEGAKQTNVQKKAKRNKKPKQRERAPRPAIRLARAK